MHLQFFFVDSEIHNYIYLCYQWRKTGREPSLELRHRVNSQSTIFAIPKTGKSRAVQCSVTLFAFTALVDLCMRYDRCVVRPISGSEITRKRHRLWAQKESISTKCNENAKQMSTVFLWNFQVDKMESKKGVDGHRPASPRKRALNVENPPDVHPEHPLTDTKPLTHRTIITIEN